MKIEAASVVFTASGSFLPDRVAWARAAKSLAEATIAILMAREAGFDSTVDEVMFARTAAPGGPEAAGSVQARPAPETDGPRNLRGLFKVW